jgi:hypothetical protein
MVRFSERKMMELQIISFMLYGLLIVMSFASASMAADITYTDVLSSDTNIISLPQFNLNGTLEEAKLSFLGTYTYGALNPLDDNVYASSILAVSIISSGKTIKEVRKTSLISIAPGETVSNKTITIDNSFTFTPDDPKFDLLAGTGSIYLMLMTDTTFYSIDFAAASIEQLAAEDFNLTKQLTGNASIKYIYSAVPLPSSIILLFFGLAGVLGYRKIKSGKGFSEVM